MWLGNFGYHIVVLLFFCCTSSAFAAEKNVVFVSVVPQKYFVEQLAGDAVEVEVMVPPGASPATYEPKPSQMVKLAKAKIYYSIGVPFEAAWLPRLRSVNPKIRLVATDVAIEKHPLVGHNHCDHEGHGGHHHHEEILDPHIWLSPPLVKKQAVVIADSLKSLLPEMAEEVDRRLVTFSAQLDALNAEFQQLFAEKQGIRFMVFHPSWGYFAREYGLEQESVEVEGKSPKPSQLAALIAEAKAEGIKTVFIQPQFSKKSAELIAREINGKVTVADALALDWPENLRRVAHLIAGEK